MSRRAGGRKRNGSMVALAGLACLTMPVLATAAASCSASAIDVDFGTYLSWMATPTLANGRLSIRCTLTSGNSTTVQASISLSAGSSGNYRARTMLSGANSLGYNLYADAAYSRLISSQSEPEPEDSSGIAPITFTLTRASPTQSTTVTIYGRLPAGQDQPPGQYVDTIIATIYF